MLGDLDRERLELGLGTVAVREPRRVAEVQVILSGQRDEQFVQDGEPADTGVEDPDRLVGQEPSRGMVSKPPAGRLAAAMRALIVTNMYPTAARPGLGSFVRDQVDALRRIEGVDIEVFSFAPGGANAYVRAASELRSRRRRHDRFDVIHAHYGLTAWPAFAASGEVRAVTLHGTDLIHPRARPVTLAALPFLDLVATVSDALATEIPRWATRGRRAVLPAGVDVGRFHPIPRAEARAALGLDPKGPYVLFSADPSRPEKRYDRALAVAGNVRLLTLGQVDRHRFRSTSTRRTRWSSHPNGRGSGWRCSRRSPAMSRCWPPPSGSTRRRSPESKEPTARRSTKPHGATRSPRTSRTRIRASTDVKEPATSRPTAWLPRS